MAARFRSKNHVFSPELTDSRGLCDLKGALTKQSAPSQARFPSISSEEFAMDSIKLNVLVYEDGDLWVAQAIEADIVATADSLADLPRATERAIVANMAANTKMGRSGLDGIPPAPAEFRERAGF